MKNFSKAIDSLNARQDFLRFTPYRILLFSGLLVFFVFYSIFGQGLVYFYVGNGSAYIYKSGTLAVHFLDVGHGDCTIIQFPDGKVAIIDGASDGGEDQTYSYYPRIKKYIDARIKPSGNKFDYVINTHPHDDHLGGLLRVMQDYKYDVFYNYENMTEGMSFGNDVYKVTFHAVGVNETEANEMSPIITIEYGNSVFLITGDAGFETEAAFVNTPTAKAIFGDNGERAEDLDVYLRVGHHGSRFSTGISFLDFIKPDVAIISAGTMSQKLYNHPNPETIARLEYADAEIYLTRDDGNIVITMDEGHSRYYFGYDNTPNLSFIWIVIFFGLTLLCFVNRKI